MFNNEAFSDRKLKITVRKPSPPLAGPLPQADVHKRTKKRPRPNKTETKNTTTTTTATPAEPLALDHENGDDVMKIPAGVNDESKTYHVSSGVLALKSAAFSKMVSAGFAESKRDAVIELVVDTDQEANDTLQMIQLLYTNEIKFDDDEDDDNKKPDIIRARIDYLGRSHRHA